MTEQEDYNSLLAKKLITEFDKRGFAGYYCETKEDALNKILEIIPANAMISYGGSATLYDIGIREALNNKKYHVFDPNAVEGALEMDKMARQALNADYYLMSSNAITEQGELVNADGYGNRVSALIFGPKNVIIVAGMNKLAPDLDAAIERVEKYAARMILLKFKKDYPDFETLDKAASGAVSQLVITRKSTVQGRIKVILVGENLGF
ncbi:MAG: lactate utilization protein [Firmicutes bacterium]|nr:lactate utilization protein [Bacillota bacterium]